MNTRSFFSKEDLRVAKRWEPDTLGARSRNVEPAGVAPGQLSDVRERAREEGFRAGFEGGAQAVQMISGQLASLLESARVGVVGQEQQMAEQLLDVALDVARQIVRTDIKVKREHVLQVIREAMDCLPQSTPNPKLFLHPNDVDLIKAHIGDELSIGAWRLIEDHRIEPGGCRISSPNCEIDATLATRWKRVIGGLGRDASWIETDAQLGATA